MFQKSDYFQRYLTEISDRMDYVFNHPDYDEVKQTVSAKVFRNLGSLILKDSIQYGLSESGQETGQFAFINIENLGRDGTLNLEDVSRVEDAPPEFLLQEGDILFSRSRLIGICSVVSKGEVGATFGSYIIRFKVNTKEIEPRYVAKFVNSELGQAQIEYLQTGSSGNNINVDQIKKLRILYVEPRRQAEILSKIKAVQTEAKQIEAEMGKVNEESSRLMMDKLHEQILPTSNRNGTNQNDSYFYKTGRDGRSPYFVVDFRELGTRLNYTFHDPRIQTLMGTLASKYETTTLSEVCREPIRRGWPIDYLPSGEALVIKTVDLKDAFIDYENCLRVPLDFWEANPEIQARKNDVLVSSTGFVSIGKADVFDKEYRAVVDRHITVLRLEEDYDPYFVTYFLRSDFGKVQFEKYWVGSSGQIEVWPVDMGQFIIPKNTKNGIPYERQKEIAESITKSLKRTRELEENRKQLISRAFQIFDTFVQENSQSGLSPAS